MAEEKREQLSVMEQLKRDKPEKSDRWRRREERRLRARKAFVAERIRVNPRDDDVRRVLSHPTVGGFRATGSIEWPLDNFTKRRLREGSVTREEASATEQRQQQRERERNPKPPPPTN
jgi:hypothetical protein